MLRKNIFLFFFFIGLLFVLIFFLPSFLLPQKITLFGGRILGYWSSICLRIFLSTKIIVKGAENINHHSKFFIASSHQSMFETFYLQTVFNAPVFILKKELLNIPIFGWYLRKIGSVSIKRNKVTKDNLEFYNIIYKIIDKTKRPLIIFPQGTRINPEDRAPFKKGVSKIYDKLKIPCLPVAINSGNVWPKEGLMRPNSTITISILKSIEPGLSKEEFLKKLENDIYTELDNLN
tara:strand:- start:1621 stop:2322 length:702 start_codon:yes stop_codon:yes gene_type:complete